MESTTGWTKSNWRHELNLKPNPKHTCVTHFY